MIRATQILMLSLASVSMLGLPAHASTQAYIGKVTAGEGAEATVVSTEISYISAKPPVGQKEMYTPMEEGIVFMVDGWYCNRETFLAAVKPGMRLHVRNNRHRPVIYGLYSTPAFVAEGTIIEAKPASREITVRHSVDHTLKITKEQHYKLPADGVLRYEGDNAAPEQALKHGRHVRAWGARKQTILAITPEARIRSVKEKKKAWPFNRGDGTKSYIWAHEGYFAGHYHGKLFFAGEPFRGRARKAGALANTYQEGPAAGGKLSGTRYLINGHYVPSSAAMRPGGRALLVPDRIHSHRRAFKVIMHPADNGAVEGRVAALEGNKLLLKVKRTPTGRVEDLTTKTLRVELEPDADYHLNGRTGVSKKEALAEGNFVRVLPGWSGAVLVRELDAERGRVSGYRIRKRLTGAVEQPVTSGGPAWFHLRFGHVLFTPLAMDRYVDAAFMWQNGKF